MLVWLRLCCSAPMRARHSVPETLDETQIPGLNVSRRLVYRKSNLAKRRHEAKNLLGSHSLGEGTTGRVAPY